MKFKHGKHKMLCAVLFFAIFISSGHTAFAAEIQTVVTLPIRQIFEVEGMYSPDALNASYRLSTTQAQAPMPQQAKTKTYDFSITGKEEVYELFLTYTKAGIYTYRLEQLSKDKDGYTYDRSVYDITVYIKNGPDGSLLSEIVVQNSDKEKCEGLVYRNKYKGKNQTDVETGDESSLLLWELMTIGSGCVLLYGYYRKKAKGNKA